MQKNKRLRVFAGPNGSGKSTLFQEYKFKTKYTTGFFVNADEVENQLRLSGLIDLQPIGLKATEATLSKFKTTKEAQSLLSKSQKEGYIIDISVQENFIVDKSKRVNSYEASFVAAFIRWMLYKNGKSFSFETVMSHPSKVAELRNAQKKGYKTYLYFVCIDNPKTNEDRVADRVSKGGHHVDPEKTLSRYKNSLKNLYPAIRYSNRVYLFDNSGATKQRLIAEIFEGVMKIKDNNLPQWFYDYVLPYFQA